MFMTLSIILGAIVGTLLFLLHKANKKAAQIEWYLEAAIRRQREKIDVLAKRRDLLREALQDLSDRVQNAMDDDAYGRKEPKCS